MKKKKVFGNTMSVTELSQNASGAIKRVQADDEPIIIMKNNKPVAVLMDIKLFNYLDGIAEEQYWERLILDRIAKDDGTSRSYEEVFGKPQPKSRANKSANQ